MQTFWTVNWPPFTGVNPVATQAELQEAAVLQIQLAELQQESGWKVQFLGTQQLLDKLIQKTPIYDIFWNDIHVAWLFFWMDVSMKGFREWEASRKDVDNSSMPHVQLVLNHRAVQHAAKELIWLQKDPATLVLASSASDLCCLVASCQTNFSRGWWIKHISFRKGQTSQNSKTSK